VNGDMDTVHLEVNTSGAWKRVASFGLEEFEDGNKHIRSRGV
jgi:hypothetical protein